MYTSVNSDKDVDDQVQIQMEELFQTPRLVQEEDTALHSGSSSHLGTTSQAENGNGSDNVHASQLAHTAIYAIKSRSNCLLISDSMEGKKITGMEFVFMDEGSFTFETYEERVSSNKDHVICEVDNYGGPGLPFDFLHIFSNCLCVFFNKTSIFYLFF